jgi:arginase family enzyme
MNSSAAPFEEHGRARLHHARYRRARHARVMDEAIAIASNGTAGFHLSLDMDFVDPEYAPGVGTPVRGGATYREAHLAMEMICDSGRMLSMEVVEVNPVIDEVQPHGRSGGRTDSIRHGKEDSLKI